MPGRSSSSSQDSRSLGGLDSSGPLSALGVSLAFTRSGSDFSRINGHEPPHEDSLFISAVFHEPFVEVNEEGTQAAAVTAMSKTLAGRAGPPSMPPPVPVFRADPPFLFAIRDRKSSAILFPGRAADAEREPSRLGGQER